jgi:Holliday junction resolvasome, DNA-binding subunit
MIRQLTGTVIAHEPPTITISVGGVGYAVAVPHTEAFPSNTDVTVHMYLAVRRPR